MKRYYLVIAKQVSTTESKAQTRIHVLTENVIKMVIHVVQPQVYSISDTGTSSLL